MSVPTNEPLGDTYPGATVTGIDFTPRQPIWVPSNVTFEIDNLEAEWNYDEKKPFYYIHGRHLGTALDKPRHVIKEAFKHLAPGGWLELQDPQLPLSCNDDTLKGTYLERWLEMVLQGAWNTNQDWSKPQHYKHWMEEEGFVDVRCEHFVWPLNEWPQDKHLQELGKYFGAFLQRGFTALSMQPFVKGLGWTRTAVEAFLGYVRRENHSSAKHRDIHAFADV